MISTSNNPKKFGSLYGKFLFEMDLNRDECHYNPDRILAKYMAHAIKTHGEPLQRQITRAAKEGIEIVRINFMMRNHAVSVDFNTQYGQLCICFYEHRFALLEGSRLSYTTLRNDRKEADRLDSVLMQDAKSILLREVEHMPWQCAKFVKKHKELLSAHMVGTVHEL